MKALILSGYGINCEDETLNAFKAAGIKGAIVHVNDLIESPSNLNNFQILALPGGFSYGDHTGSGNAMAHKIKNNLFEYIIKFIEQDKLIIGICNGCQILINLGIVPSLKGYKRELALVENDIGTYQCRWIKLKIVNDNSPWLKKINQLHLPVAHQEGKFIADKKVIDKLIRKKLIACKYVNNRGLLAKQQFPYNPNGSLEDIAAITNLNGNVLAMMPHPERALYLLQKPDWIIQKRKKNDKLLQRNELYADGYKIFKNAYNYFK
jgi:phosphoribosylformylglycinamidine synthase